MRTPGRTRPQPKALAAPLEARELQGWAEDVTYIGSPEHKTYPSFAGRPVLRSDATPCPREFNDAKSICAWLRDAILRGNVSAYRDQGTYPRYVWDLLNGQWFEARLVNATSGSYKGYPVTEDNIPRELRKRLT